MCPTAISESRSAPPRIRRALLLAGGAVILALAFWGPVLDPPHTQAHPLTRTVGSTGLGLIVFGLAFGTSWQRCAGILGGTAIAQTAALSLVDAPNYTVLQHYFRWRDLMASRQLFLLLVVVQSAIVLPAAWRRRHHIRDLFRILLPAGRFRLLILAFLVLAMGANASFEWTRFAAEIGLSVWIAALSFACLALAAAAAPAAPIRAATEWISRRFPGSVWDRRLPIGCAAIAILVSAALCWTVFGRVPHVPDEVSYLFQAKYLAAGKLYLPAPPDRDAFEIGQVINDGQKWYGYGFPGWPVTLSLGVRLGFPWLVNPLLAGAIVLLAHRLIEILYNRQTAHAAALLLVVSPWFLFMSASFMTHNLSFALALGGFVALEQQKRSRRIWWSVLAGLCLGAVVLTRPLEGVVVGTVMGLWSLGLGGSRLRFREIVCFGAISILFGSLLLPYVHALTGSYTRTPQQVWTDATFYPGSDRLGFGSDIGNWGWYHLDPFPGHGARDVLVNAHQNLYTSNFELFGWGFGSLLFVLIALLLGRRNRADRLLLALAAGVLVAQSFYWFSGGPDYGARYWYQMLIPFAVLTVQGIQQIQRRCLATGASRLSAQVPLFVACAAAVALVTFLPWRIAGKYHNFRRVSSDIRQLAERSGFGRALVFVEETGDDYASAFVFNPPTLESPGPIYARSTNPAARAAISRNFPGRSVWFVARPSSDKPFAVTAGPLPAATKDK